MKAQEFSHANLVVGDIESGVTKIKDLLMTELDVPVVGNPNVIERHVARLGIDTARELVGLQVKTGVGTDSRKFFIIAFGTVTVEAQNALLKTLEDPTEATTIFLVTPTDSIVLPTILSRVQLFDNRERGDLSEAEAFLKMSFVEREKCWGNFLADKKKDMPADRVGALDFIESLLQVVSQNKGRIENWTEVYHEIEQVKQYLTDRSSSLKYIFEYISIKIPVL